jgi:hypothetical protein
MGNQKRRYAMLDFNHEPDGWRPLSRQELFTKAYVGVMLQGRPSMNGHAGHCAYRGDGGAKCGVGFLIDDKTAASWDSRMSSSICGVAHSMRGDDAFEVWVMDNVDLLQDIQEAHDGFGAKRRMYEEAGVTFREAFHAEASEIARKNGLTVPDMTALLDITEPCAA